MLHDLFSNAQLSPEQRQALQNLQNELSEARAQLKKLETKITDLETQVQAEHTVLTRPEFNREVARMLAFDERYGGVSSVLYYDFSGLSGLASRHGPAFLSTAIGVLSQTMASSLRRSDIIGRLAADEFGVLMPRCNNENAWKKGRELAAILMIALEQVEGHRLGLDISFGAYTFRDDENLATGIKAAAQAMTKLGPT